MIPKHPLYNFLPLLGLLMLLFYFYIRLFIPKLPQSIPYNLTSLSIISLSFIITVYSIHLISIISQGSIIGSGKIQKALSLLLLPIRELDEKIKSHNYSQPKYYKRINRLSKLLNLFNTFYNPQIKSSKFHIIVFIFQIVPHIILLSTLIVETFFLDQISLFYSLLPITMIFLINLYLTFSINKIHENFLKKLEDCTQNTISSRNDAYNLLILTRQYQARNDEEEDFDSFVLARIPVREAMEDEIKTIVITRQQLDLRPFVDINKYIADHGYIVTHSHRMNKWSHLDSILTHAQKTSFFFIRIILSTGVFLEEYTLASNTPFFKKTKAIIFSGYITCWGYIFLFSTQAQNLIEPFSEIML